MSLGNPAPFPGQAPAGMGPGGNLGFRPGPAGDPSPDEAEMPVVRPPAPAPACQLARYKTAPEDGGAGGVASIIMISGYHDESHTGCAQWMRAFAPTVTFTLVCCNRLLNLRLHERVNPLHRLGFCDVHRQPRRAFYRELRAGWAYESADAR